MSIISSLNAENSIPRHIVLFPDGNRRWAKDRGLDTLEGHKAGYEKLIDFVAWCQDKGVLALTAFGFSTENWNREQREVSYLMQLLEDGIRELGEKFTTDPLYKNRGIRLRVIGQKERLPQTLQGVITDTEEKTKGNRKFSVTLAVSYGGRWDIVQAAQKMMREGIHPEEVTEELFSSYLSTASLPNPDLVIRAGGEKRFSNFLLWQSAYAELYFSSKYWPDFSEHDLDEALAEYSSRQRRFGH